MIGPETSLVPHDSAIVGSDCIMVGIKLALEPREERLEPMNSAIIGMRCLLIGTEQGEMKCERVFRLAQWRK